MKNYLIISTIAILLTVTGQSYAITTPGVTLGAPPLPPVPTADIKANGSNDPITIPYNTAATITWTSSNVTSCSITPSNWSGISGSQSTGNLVASITYTLSCTGTGGSATDSVTVNIEEQQIALAISNIAVTVTDEPSNNTYTATIVWNTNKPALSTVEYGTTATTLTETKTETAYSQIHTASLTGLQRKTKYYYNITAKDEPASETESGTQSFSTPARSPKPTKVNGLKAQNGSVILSWQNPEYEFLQKNVVIRGTDTFPNNPLSSQYTPIEITDLALQTYNDTNVVYGTTYYYSVFTVDDQNTYSDAATVSFTPTAPQTDDESTSNDDTSQDDSSDTASNPPATSSGGGGGGGGGSSSSSGGGGGGGSYISYASQNPSSQSSANASLAGNGASSGGNGSFMPSLGSIPLPPSFGENAALASHKKSGFSFTSSLGLGMENQEVRALQELLARDPEVYPEGKITEYFGALTQNAVQRFQKKYGIASYGTPDTTGYGWVGPKTRQKLNEISGNTMLASDTIGKQNSGGIAPFPIMPALAPPAYTKTKPGYVFTLGLSQGMENQEVRALQELLARDPEVYPEGKITGYFGTLTKKAVQRFQCKYNIVCVGDEYETGYGVVGPKTRIKLNEFVTSTPSVSNAASPVSPISLGEGRTSEEEQIKQMELIIAELEVTTKLLQKQVDASL